MKKYKTIIFSVIFLIVGVIAGFAVGRLTGGAGKPELENGVTNEETAVKIAQAVCEEHFGESDLSDLTWNALLYKDENGVTRWQVEASRPNEDQNMLDGQELCVFISKDDGRILGIYGGI